MGLSQYELGNKVGMQHSMIGSSERDKFYPTLNSINKLGSLLDITVLCSEGYSKFLIGSSTFKDKLIKWRLENKLTKRSASKLIGISEIGYNSWEKGTIINTDTYDKTNVNLFRYKLL